MTNRIRWRYLALQVEGATQISEKEIVNVVWNSLLQLFGEYGASQTNLSFIEFNLKHDVIIARCTHLTLEMVRATVATVREMNEKPLTLRVAGVSGTLKALKRKLHTHMEL